MNEEQREYYEERAAIREHCGRASRSDAEKMALIETRKRFNDQSLNFIPVDFIA